MSSTIRGIIPILQWELVTEGKASTVMGFLPASLSSRIRPIPSLRRSMSLSSLKAEGGPEALPRPLSSGDAEAYEEERMQLCVRSQEMDVAASGVRIRFAQQGANLVRIAAQSGWPIQNERSSFERKAYVDGVSYLLRGLPEDLDAHELGQIASALPASMRPITQGEPAFMKGKPESRSSIHMAVQWLTACLILMIHALIPYLIFLCRYVVSVERRYRLVGTGMELANSLGRRSIAGVENVLRMHDGQVGRALSAVLAWLVEGITRGISDGVGEGMMRIRLSAA